MNKADNKNRIESVKTLQVRVDGGYLVATICSDPDYPGIDVEFVADDDNGEKASRPRVLFEKPLGDVLRVLVWNDQNSEDYSEEIQMLADNDPT